MLSNDQITLTYRRAAGPAAGAEDSWPLKTTMIDGAHVRYVDVGRGEPILLLHGYPQNHRCWRKQIKILSQTHRVIAPDWIGWGQSERSFAVAPEYSLEVARIGALLDAIGIDRVNLFAHDYGGFLALGFVTKHPERVRRFAILNSRAHRTFSRATYLLFAIQCKLARIRGLRRILELLPMQRLHRMGLDKHVARGCFDRALRDDYVGWLGARSGKRWLSHFYRHYDARPRPELALGLSKIGCPTAVVWGDSDAFLPFAIGRDLADRIPGASMHRLRGADHFVMEERPEEVTSVLCELLARPVRPQLQEKT